MVCSLRQFADAAPYAAAGESSRYPACGLTLQPARTVQYLPRDVARDNGREEGATCVCCAGASAQQIEFVCSPHAM